MRSLDPPLVPAPGPEPAYCPRCELRHTRRPDWLCPRCGSPVDTDVPPPRATPAPLPAPRYPLGSRLAGALLALTGGAFAGDVARDLAMLPGGSAQRWQLLVAMLALAALGLALVLGVSAARWVALAVAVVAAVILAEGLVRVLSPGLVRDPVPAPVRQVLRDLIRDHRPARILLLLGYDLGCLLLVAGRPRAARMTAGVLLATPVLVLRLVVALAR